MTAGTTPERRAAPRFRVILPALCTQAGLPDFYAVTDDVSAGGIRFKSAARVRLDEPLTCRIRHIGTLETRVIRTDPKAFVARITTRRPAADELASKLIRMSAKQQGACDQIRACARITPHQTDTLVALADGSRIPARILNVSASGAGVLLDRLPALDHLVLVGKTPARVVRHFDGGCGVAFVTPFDRTAVDERLVL
jgi:hypothetical protein